MVNCSVQCWHGQLAQPRLGLRPGLPLGYFVSSPSTGAASYGEAIGALLGGWGQGLADLAMAALSFGEFSASVLLRRVLKVSALSLERAWAWRGCSWVKVRA
jgi:hypothetical protein